MQALVIKCTDVIDPIKNNSNHVSFEIFNAPRGRLKMAAGKIHHIKKWAACLVTIASSYFLLGGSRGSNESSK
jgi:hypothetical protein